MTRSLSDSWRIQASGISTQRAKYFTSRREAGHGASSPAWRAAALSEMARYSRRADARRGACRKMPWPKLELICVGSTSHRSSQRVFEDLIDRHRRRADFVAFEQSVG